MKHDATTVKHCSCMFQQVKAKYTLFSKTIHSM